MLRKTFHVIALFIRLVYLHQLLDLIGSSRRVICASFISVQLENLLKIISHYWLPALNVTWGIVLGCGLNSLSVNVSNYLYIVSACLSLSSPSFPSFSIFPSVFPVSDLKITLRLLHSLATPSAFSHIVSLSLSSLSCCVVCFPVEVRRQRQPQRDYCVCLGLCVWWSRWPSRQHQEPRLKSAHWLVWLPMSFIPHKSSPLLSSPPHCNVHIDSMWLNSHKVKLLHFLLWSQILAKYLN